jgi:hypothetical protein
MTILIGMFIGEATSNPSEGTVAFDPISVQAAAFVSEPTYEPTL